MGNFLNVYPSVPHAIPLVFSVTPILESHIHIDSFNPILLGRNNPSWHISTKHTTSAFQRDRYLSHAYLCHYGHSAILFTTLCFPIPNSASFPSHSVTKMKGPIRKMFWASFSFP